MGRHVDGEQCKGGLLSPLIACRGAGLFYRLKLPVAFAAAVSTCIKTGSFAVTDPPESDFGALSDHLSSFYLCGVAGEG